MTTTITPDGLARAAIGGFVILAVAAAAVRLCREPADRVRIIAIGLVGALLLPILGTLPGLPRWPLRVLPAESVTEPIEMIAYSPDGNTAAVATSQSGPAAQHRTVYKTAKVRSAPKQEVTETTSASTESTTTTAEAISAVREVALAPNSPETASPGAGSSWSMTAVAIIAYGLATTGFALWSLLGLWRVAALRRRARPASSEASDILREIAGTAAGRVQLLVSDEIDAPIALGIWRPVIVLPAHADCGDATEALHYGLAHEWSHIERGDVLRWHLVALAQIVLFYQPLFWWLRRQLRLSQDYLADARSADHTEPVDYAAYLVSLARRRLTAPSFALGITDRRSALTRRVHMLLLSPGPLSRRCRLAWTVGAASVVLGLVFALSAVRLTEAAAPAAPAPEADEVKKPAAEPKPAPETLHYTGKVSDKDTKKGIAGATVIVRRSILGDPTRDERNPVVKETKHTTDAEGKYSFTIPPEQTAERYLYIELDVEHPDYAAQKNFGYALSMIRKNEKLGGRPFFESVELRPAKPVMGVVQTPDGKPAAGVKVMAFSVTSKRGNGVFEYGSFVDTRTDAAGKFRLPLTTPGWAVVWVLPEQFVPTTHVLNEKRGDLGAFTLATGPRLKGRLLDAKGKPLAGVIVNAECQDRNEEITQPVADNINRSTITNEKGEFEMKPLPPGNYVVKPGDYANDNSLDRKDQKRASIPGVFVGTKVHIKAGGDPEPVEVRAVPHVTIEAQTYDSKGKPTRGHAPHIFGRIDGIFWFGEAKIDPNGKVTAMAPHGLEEVQLNLMTNEHGVLRWRRGKDGPLNFGRRIMLGTLNDDVHDIEIIKYTAPILVVKVTIKGWDKPPFETAVTANYPKGKEDVRYRLIVAGGRESDVNFEKQEDGRFRSMQMLPDVEIEVTGHAEGYESSTQKVSLAEGASRDIEIVLERSAPKKKEEEKPKK